MQATFPAGAVTTDTTVTYVEKIGPTQGMDGFSFAGTYFVLEAVDAAGNPVTSFNQPFTITIYYDDADWQNADIWSETGLSLSYWDTALSAWVDLSSCGGCSLDTINNVLVVVLDHLTEFAALGSALFGDLDGNCAVDAADVAFLASMWKMTSGHPDWMDVYDFDGDNRVSVIDIITLQAYWGSSCE